MARLPQPAGDDGTWGNILNDYLSQAHNIDGTIKNGVVTDATISSSAAISQTKIASLTTDLATTEKTANKGVASGYAPLNSSLQVPVANLPIGTTGATITIGNDSRFTSLGSVIQTASYTLTLADVAGVIEMNSLSALTVTIPPNSAVAFPVGAILEVIQYGVGQVTIVAGAGVIIRTPSSVTSRTQYAALSLRQRATNEWVLGGDMS